MSNEVYKAIGDEILSSDTPVADVCARYGVTVDTVQAPKRTREEAAEMVLRSMVADMRRQGWTLSNDQADEMVARIRKEILQ